MKSKERPILFSGPMVRAIIGGRKTVTRRIVKLHPPYMIMGEKDDGSPWPDSMNPNDGGDYRAAPCPYGVPGDRLWVRETWQHFFLGNDPAACCYLADAGTLRWPNAIDKEHALSSWPGWKSPILMPRWASRLTLEVVSIRVERLREITEEEVEREGVTVDSLADFPKAKIPSGHMTGRTVFRCGWNAMHGKSSWIANPWVWRIEFQRVQ